MNKTKIRERSERTERTARTVFRIRFKVAVYAQKQNIYEKEILIPSIYEKRSECRAHIQDEIRARLQHGYFFLSPRLDFDLVRYSQEASYNTYLRYRIVTETVFQSDLKPSASELSESGQIPFVCQPSELSKASELSEASKVSEVSEASKIDRNRSPLANNQEQQTLASSWAVNHGGGEASRKEGEGTASPHSLDQREQHALKSATNSRQESSGWPTSLNARRMYELRRRLFPDSEKRGFDRRLTDPRRSV